MAGFFYVLDTDARILFVDDDPILREFAQVNLASPHVEIDTAGDGIEALERLAVTPYNLLLVDLEAPELAAADLSDTVCAAQQPGRAAPVQCDRVRGGMIGIPGPLRSIRLALGALKHDVRGVIALKFALAVPAVALLAIGAIDLTAVNATRDRLQDVADSAALAGAPSLGLATDGAAARERASAFFQAQMTQWANPPKVEPNFSIIDQGGQRAIRVVLKGHRASFFGSMLPPGGWHFTAQATASTVGLVPLCVLVTGGSLDKGLSLRQSPRMSAPGCMVHSNQHIGVEGGSISAARVQAVGAATGVISPTPGTGAARISDPFADMALNANRP